MHRIPAARTSSSESSCSPAAVSSGHTSSIEIPSSQDPASGYTGSGSKSGTIWLILFMTIPPEAMITAAAAAARIHTGAHPRPGRAALRPEPALWCRDTGASNDIEQATKLARAMVTRYGMSEQFGMVALETVTNQYLGGDTSLACSPETARAIDEEVIKTVKEQYGKAMEILKEHAGKLIELSAYLLEKETITGEEFMEILNR